MVKINYYNVNIFVFLFLYTASSIYAKLDDLSEIALKFNTDKNYLHNYTPVYDFYFNKMRNSILKFLEIGYYRGESARTWQEYFPNATLHFIDIDPNSFKLHSHGISKERCKFHLVDQGNEESLKKFAEEVKGDFDIIIDDGGHTMKQQILSFKVLFPLLKSGGIYVIEDLHTSYWPAYIQGHPETCIDFLKRLADDVNFIAAQTGSADIQKIPEAIKQKANFYQLSIKSLHFYSGICFIVKN